VSISIFFFFNNDYFKCTQFMRYFMQVLHARHITLPNPERVRLLNMKIKLNQASNVMIPSTWYLGLLPYTRGFKEDTPTNTLATWMGTSYILFCSTQLQWCIIMKDSVIFINTAIILHRISLHWKFFENSNDLAPPVSEFQIFFVSFLFLKLHLILTILSQRIWDNPF